MNLSRREMLAALAAVTASTWLEKSASALGRTPAFGRVSMTLPWPVSSIDPADPLDATAALFAHAIADPVYAVDAQGEPYPALAVDYPVVSAGKTVVKLRPGLVSARGQAISARDLVFTIERARRFGGAPWLANLPLPKLVPGDPLAVSFDTNDREQVARALSAPTTSLVPRGFSPERPDGTGAMRAEPSAERLVLVRNPNAARGASFLDEIVVDRAGDLSASLRAFEAHTADVGWLGAGLHGARARSVPFDLGSVGWIVLRTGQEAGAWGAPGVAQQLVDALPAERLQHLGLGSLPSPVGDPAWGGPPGALLFDEGAAQLGEIARTIASLLSRPGHELVAQPMPRAELARRRSSGAFLAMLHVVRPIGGPGLATLAALSAAVDPRAGLDVVRRPPRLPNFAPRSLTRTLRLGVVGELRVAGAHSAELRLARSANGEGWDLGASHRLPRRTA